MPIGRTRRSTPGPSWKQKFKEAVRGKKADEGFVAAPVDLDQLRTEMKIGARPATDIASRSASPLPTPAFPGTTLGQEECKRLERIKARHFKDVVVKLGDMTGEPNADAEAASGPTTKGGKVWKWIRHHIGQGEDASDAVGTSGGIADLKLGDDHDVPLVSSITGFISGIFQLCKAGKKIWDDWDKARSTKDNLKNMAVNEGLDIGMSLAALGSSAMTMVKDFREAVEGLKYGKTIPIIGAVIGTGMDCIDLFFNMKDAYYLWKHSKGVRKEKGVQEGEGPKGINLSTGKTIKDATTGKMRAMRTDEALDHLERNAQTQLEAAKTAASAPGLAGSAKEDADRLVKERQAALDDIGRAKEVDMVKEIKGAIGNRARNKGLDIGQNIMSLMASLASFDVSGAGETAGAIISATNGIVSAGRFGTSVSVQFAKNHGLLGANLNKSKRNKLERRHHLGVTMFKTIRDTKPLGVHTMDPHTISTPQAREDALQKIARYKTVESRYKALQISRSSLMLAENATEAVMALRQGFYQDSQ